MGGSVAVTVRFSADSEFRMLWGTGGLETFKGKGFVCREAKYLEECKARWSDADYKGLLAPVGYGLVVVDFVTNRMWLRSGHAARHRNGNRNRNRNRNRSYGSKALEHESLQAEFEIIESS